MTQRFSLDRRVRISRGLAGRLALLEAFGPARFDGWAVEGDEYRCVDHGCGCGWVYACEIDEPMGRCVTVPFIRIMATEEGQTGHVDDTAYF